MLKNSLLSKPLLPLSLLAAVLCGGGIALRVSQFKNNIEFATGFYSKADFTATALYIFIAVAAVLPFVYSLAVRKKQPVLDYEAPFRARIPAAIASFLFIAANSVAVGNNFSSAARLYLQYGESTLTYLHYSGFFVTVACGVVGALACVYFALYAVSCLNKRVKAERFKLLALTPSIWLMCRMFGHFMVEQDYTNVSQRMLEMVAIMAALAFSFRFASETAHFGATKAVWRTRSYALTAAVLLLVSSVPVLVMRASGADVNITGTVQAVDLTYALLIILSVR